jgi:hypothetical protein
VTSEALTEALRASQAKAVATLGKAYIRRDEEPDDDLFRALLLRIGLDDEVAIGFLLQGWKVLREYREPAPDAPAPPPKRETEPATDAQWARIRRDCDQRSLVAPDMELTKAQASEVIERIAAGTYQPDEWARPF